MNRKHYIRLLYGIYCICLVCIYSTAPGQSYKPLTEYTTENGLAINSVNDLLFDSNGFLWIATADGLQCFDGYNFKTFRNDISNKKSLAENYVHGLYEDNNGNLWITHRTGISLKPKGKLEFINLSFLLPEATFRFPFSCVGETDSSVMIIDYPAGIFSFNKRSLSVKKVSGFEQFPSKDRICLLSHLRSKNEKAWLRRGLSKDGDIYLVTEQGLKHFSNEKKQVLHFIIPAGNDSVIMITDKMLFKSCIKDPFTPGRVLQDSVDVRALDNPFAFWPGKMGNGQWLLMGTKKILIYDEAKMAIVPSRYSDYLGEDINLNLVVTAADMNENSWMGYTGLGGIRVLSPGKFDIFNRPEKNALPYCLGMDNKSNVYVGIYLGDIEVYDKKGNYLRKIILPAKRTEFSSPRCLLMIDSSTMIVKSGWDDMYAIDVNTGTIQTLSGILPPKPDSTIGDFEFGAQKIAENEIWFSWRNNILSLKKSGNKYTCGNIASVPGVVRINDLYYSRTGALWIGTVMGAWLFEKGNLQKIPLPSNYIKHINERRENEIWITTTDGIFVLENKKLVHSLETKNGLPNSFVYAVLFDNTGNAWASTNRGLAKIVPGNYTDTSWQITSYTVKEGLQGEEFNTKGYCKATDGTLYFAGTNGINFFKPNDIIRNKAVVQTMLTGIEVNGRTYLPNLQPELINNIDLSYQQNNIRLSFACNDLTVPEKNQYKFLLKGFQDEWSQPQTNNSVQYILPPGEYKLYVLGANYEGTWSKEPLLLRINIRPPWYQTTWARIIFLLLGLAMAGFVFYIISRSRYQKKLRQLQIQQDVQKEKERLSRDLHDNLGSQITWLSNNISQLENTLPEQEPAIQKLSRLKEGTGELMQTLRETIWILNKDKISCVELCDKVVSFAARLVESCPGIQLQIEEDIDPLLNLNAAQALQVFRICQEAINNACKHSHASLLSIAADTKDSVFKIRISDNGKGFEQNKPGREGHYGLQNMRQRAEESELKLSIESTIDGGTVIAISF